MNNTSKTARRRLVWQIRLWTLLGVGLAILSLGLAGVSGVRAARLRQIEITRKQEDHPGIAASPRPDRTSAEPATLPKPQIQQVGLVLAGSFVVGFLWVAWGVLREVNTQLKLSDEHQAAAVAARQTEETLTRQNHEMSVTLAETSNLLETMWEKSPAAIYFKNCRSEFCHLSASFRSLYHLPPEEELRGKTDFDLFPREQAEAAFHDEQEIIRTGQALASKVEKRVLRDGHATWTMTAKLPWRDQNGNIIGIFGLATNITSLKETDEKLAAAHRKLQVSEQRFRTLSAAAPIGIFLTDARGKILYVNPHWLSITGLTLEASLGNGWQQALHPEDTAEVLEAGKAAARRGWGFSHEYRFRRPTGEVRWVRSSSVAVRSDTGQPNGYVGTTEDITERRQSEELLRLREAALQAAANIIVITDRAGNILWTNPAFTKTTGYTAEEVLGKNPRILRQDTGTPPPSEYYQTLWKTISAGAVWHGEFQNVRKDGSPLIEDATITPVPNQKGEITHFVAVKQDITARKRAEAELAQAQKDLLVSTRLAGMAEVATGVLHNVGNVLNSVNVGAHCAADTLRKSRLSRLKKVTALLQEQRADLGNFFAHDPRGQQLPGYLEQLTEHLLREQANAISELTGIQKHIEHIKDIVAVQQNFAKVSGVRESVPVPRLVEDALQMDLDSLARHDVLVVKEFAEVPPVVVDKHKAMQILLNLIRNAKQACEATERDDKQVTLRIANGDNRVHISVADNGVGISPENLTRVFNHGFTTKRDGHGFGLHSGALAAREMGGALQVHSAGVGHGATFTLELPTQAGGSA